MPIFSINENSLSGIEQRNFNTEKELQSLIEGNLDVIFNSRFVATEFSTGVQHAGRIDTLALSEESNPVIIEYKKVESSELVNQSLFYLSWIYDHRGDFEIAAQKALGRQIAVNWLDVRVICIAPNYKKYDLHAVQMTGANIELWKYRLFSNNSLYLEKIYHQPRTSAGTPLMSQNMKIKNPVMVEAGKKAARKRAMRKDGLLADFSFEQHIRKKPASLQKLASIIREFTLGLDDSIQEEPRKYYLAYTTSRNILCMSVRSRNVKLWLKLDPTEIPKDTANWRNVSSIGHCGTGDVEFTVKTNEDFERMRSFIVTAYNRIGG